MWSHRLRSALLVALYLSALLLAGCAVTAPVQEMSDARQALRAAEQAGAPERALPAYQQALDLLDSAEVLLQAGEYRRARDKAELSRAHSLEARQQAIELSR
ncbi:MAG: DUF4398 domain-containing protein [Thioalkalivibrio sp.]